MLFKENHEGTVPSDGMIIIVNISSTITIMANMLVAGVQLCLRMSSRSLVLDDQQPNGLLLNTCALGHGDQSSQCILIYTHLYMEGERSTFFRGTPFEMHFGQWHLVGPRVCFLLSLTSKSILLPQMTNR